MNAIALAQRRFTPEDLLCMPDGSRYELVDGELVEKTVSLLSSFVAGELFARARDHNKVQPQGWIFPEGTSYQCFPDGPGKVRRPDMSFIRLNRLSLERFNQEGHCTVTPDLLAEIVSPNDLVYVVDRKVQDFLDAGAQLVWVINPDVRTVKVHRADGTGAILTEKDTLSGESVFHGFSCKIADLFIVPQPF